MPEDFELEPLLSVSPSHFRVHEPVRVAIRVDDEIAFLMKDWGDANEGVFEFDTSNLQHIIDQVLSLGRRAELLSPPSARQNVIDALRAVLRTHGALAEAAS